MGLLAELSGEMTLIAKSMAQSDFTQAPLGIDEVVAGEADPDSAEVLLGREAEFAHKKPLQCAH